jgi:hypothetical protein
MKEASAVRYQSRRACPSRFAAELFVAALLPERQSPSIVGGNEYLHRVRQGAILRAQCGICMLAGEH